MYTCKASTYNDKPVIAAETTIPYTAFAGAEVKTFVIKGVYNDGESEQQTFTQNVVCQSVETVVCPVCEEAIDRSGSIIHTVCAKCGDECVDGVVDSHIGCGACGVTKASAGSEQCNGTGIVHNKCSACGAECTGEGIAHLKCTACGGICAGNGIVHKKCDSCAAKCEGNGILHTNCSACGKPCIDGSIAHKVCSECGAVCDGTGIVHKSHTADEKSDNSYLISPATEDTSEFFLIIDILTLSICVIAVFCLCRCKQR